MTNIKPHDPEGIGGCLLVTKRIVSRMIGVSQHTVDRLRVRDSNFPAPVDLASSKIYWRRKDIENYIENLGRSSK